MVTGFKNFIKEKNLFNASDKLLLAVSGGLDSVVMLHLFYEAGFKFGICHCNFMLRGNESDEDEHFVKKLADNYKVAFYSKQFNTLEFAESEKISVQMSARNLRYKWFEEVKKKEGYDYIATAHHKDDEIETFFINLLKGAGIEGLKGIPVKRGNIIRPLLFANRKIIEEYARDNGLKWREDASNSEEKYLRNKIRHSLIPVLKEISPDAKSSIERTRENLFSAQLIINETISSLHKKVISEKNGDFYLEIDKLKSIANAPHYLYYLLKPFNFNFSDAEDIYQALEAESGKQFFSSTHRLIKDRSDLIITSLKTVKPEETVIIEENESSINSPIQLKIAKTHWDKNMPISQDPAIAFLDSKNVKFPLTLRKWKAGDTFNPLGMKGKQNISDFLTGLKMSLLQKENTRVLLSGNEIIWVVGLRINNFFKITPTTEEALIIEFKNK